MKLKMKGGKCPDCNCGKQKGGRYTSKKNLSKLLRGGGKMHTHKKQNGAGSCGSHKKQNGAGMHSKHHNKQMVLEVVEVKKQMELVCTVNTQNKRSLSCGSHKNKMEW